MRTMNKIVIIGRVGRDPELRTSQSGVNWLNLAVATNRPKKDGATWIEETDWHTVKVFGKEAETMMKIVKRGALVAVEGSVSYDRWTSSDGQKQNTTRILADRVSLLSSPADREVDAPAATEATQASIEAPF
jgi:single-strand DNA-binding protein